MQKVIINKEKVLEFTRFCIVGCLASGIHYAVYYLLQRWLFLSRGELSLSLAYTAGYVVSLLCNFFMTTFFTFHSTVSAKKVVGFGFSHLVNYSIHIVFFNAFLLVGVNRLIAPVFVLMLAVPTNFLLLHIVFRSKMFD